MEKSIEDYKRELMELYRSRPIVPANSQAVREQDTPITEQRPIVPFAQNDEQLREPYTGKGGLMVALTHSRGTYPVEGASVSVLDKNGRVIDREVTDNSGKTTRLLLPAPSKILSEAPGESYSNVAAFYDLKIEAENFVPVTIKGVPIFDGVNTTQPLDLTYTASAASNQPIVISFSNTNTL